MNGSLERIENLWARVSGPVALAAGDVLYQLSRSQVFLREGSLSHVDLTTMFAKEVQPIVEYCIRHRESLPSVFSYGGSADRNVIRFLINVLGRIGDVTAIAALQEIADDPEFGRDAIAAIEGLLPTVIGKPR